MIKIGEEQFIAIYRSTVDGLYSFVHSRTKGSQSLTQDIVQETYLRAITAWQYRGVPRNPGAWLVKVARNLHVSYLRKAGHEILTDEPTEESVEPVDLAKTEQIQFTQKALSKVRKGYARLIEAFHFDGRKVSEIARKEGISERAVEGRLRRARVALRDELESYTKGENGS